jgi:hypothetical protein
MDRYNFRTTSLNNAQLNAELTKRGAKTFGSLQRKQQRLQRFIDAEEASVAKRSQERDFLRIVVENEQRKVYDRAQARANEIRRSARITTLLGQYLGY